MDGYAPPPIQVDTVEVDTPELSRVIATARGLGAFFYRRDPDTGEELLGLGSSLDLTAASFRESARRLQAFGQGVAVGWTSFGLPGLTRQEPRDIPSWEPFSHRHLHVPALLLRRRSETTTAAMAGLDGKVLLKDLLATLPTELQKEPLQDSLHADLSEVPLPDDEPAFRHGLSLFVEHSPFPKVVLSRRALLEASEPLTSPRRLQQILTTLTRSHPTCVTFAISPSSDGPVFVGATPELLVKARGAALETVALAGTTRDTNSSETHAEDALLQSPKDLEEHRIVVDMIRDVLTRLATDLDAPDTPTLRRLQHLAHLETPIKATLHNDRSIADALDALHPTPAVCGFPRAEARAFIAEVEPFDRGLYAGAFGWMDAHGNGRFDVALRCALLHDRRALLFAGAGLTAESDADIEWAETERKLTALRQALKEAA